MDVTQATLKTGITKSVQANLAPSTVWHYSKVCKSQLLQTNMCNALHHDHYVVHKDRWSEMTVDQTTLTALLMSYGEIFLTIQSFEKNFQTKVSLFLKIPNLEIQCRIAELSSMQKAAGSAQPFQYNAGL